MTSALLGVGLMAALFATFGLLRRGVRAGEGCEGCAGGCTECPGLAACDLAEVDRVRK